MRRTILDDKRPRRPALPMSAEEFIWLPRAAHLIRAVRNDQLRTSHRFVVQMDGIHSQRNILTGRVVDACQYPVGPIPR